MDCLSLIIRCSTCLASPVPLLTNSFCALNRRIRSSALLRRKDSLKGSIPLKSRRCRIKATRIRVLLLAAAELFTLIGCRQDMHNEPKFIPLRSSEFFPDRRSARYPVGGTIPRLEDARLDREQLDPNSYFLTGRHGQMF